MFVGGTSFPPPFTVQQPNNIAMSLLATKIAQCANTNPNTFIEQSLAATLGQHFQSGLDKKSAITTVLTSLNAFDPTQYATYWAQLM